MESDSPGDFSLGELELEVLRYVVEHPGISVGEVAREFALRRNLARTTLLTVMERLRSKRYLSRRQKAGTFQYFSRHSKTQLMHLIVKRFAERTLGGSIDPFVSYLMGHARLTEEQIGDLKKLVEEAERKNERGRK